MFIYSPKSKEKLLTCHIDLQKLFNEVIKHVDCTVLEGNRGKDRQDEVCRQGWSTLMFPNSKHNSLPSQAVDVAPYPIDWEDKEKFYYFGGIVKGIATQMGINIRWGGDWDSDNDLHDQTLFDLPHFELKG